MKLDNTYIYDTKGIAHKIDYWVEVSGKVMVVTSGDNGYEFWEGIKHE